MLLSEAYRTLGLSRGASKEEVRTAYKRLSLLHHPDKNRESSERFLQISEAYQIILLYLDSNTSSKRPNDDSHGSDSEFDYGFLYEKLSDMLRRLRDQYFTSPKIYIEIDCTLEDIVMMNYKRVTWKWKDKDNQMQTDTAYIPLFSLETCFTLSECGDFSKMKQTRGDVVIQLNRADHPSYALSTLFQKYDLIYTVHITLYEFYYGFTLKTPPIESAKSPETHSYLGTERVILPYKEGTEIVIPGKGLRCKNNNQGDLYIVIHVDHTLTNDSILDAQDTREWMARLFTKTTS